MEVLQTSALPLGDGAARDRDLSLQGNSGRVYRHTGQRRAEGSQVVNMVFNHKVLGVETPRQGSGAHDRNKTAGEG